MLRSFVKLLCNRCGRVTVVGLVLVLSWIIWYVLPQRPVEIVRDNAANYWNRDFGPAVDFGFRAHPSFDTDAMTRLFEETDPTWTIKFLDDNRLEVKERGTGKVLCTLPSADYRWPHGSRFGHRLSVQVDERIEVWDVRQGQRVYTGPYSTATFLSVDGRHLSFMNVEELYGTTLEIIDVDRGQQIVEIREGMKLSPWLDSQVVPKLDRFRWSTISAGGQLLAMEIRDKENRAWLWVWNLTNRQPAVLMPLAESSFGVPIFSEPSFGTSSRYLASINDRQRLHFDFGTVPPTNLSWLLADFEIDHVNAPIRITGNRAIACNRDESQLRVWDLDKREVLGEHDFSGHIALSPDDQYAIVWTRHQPNPLQRAIMQVQRWAGQQPDDVLDAYVIINMDTGKVVNRIVSTGLHQFNPELRSVWSCESSQQSEEDEFIFKRYLLRASPPPWWLWVLTIAGLILWIREAWNLRRERQLAS